MALFGIGFSKYENHWSKFKKVGNEIRGDMTITKGNSSVWKWDIKSGRIEIIFLDEKFNESKYIYYKNEIGERNYSWLKRLARRGKGLNSFILRNKVRGRRV